MYDINTAMRLRAYRALPLLLLLPIQAYAARVLSVQARRDPGHFSIDMHITIDAPSREVFQALQDFPSMARYNRDLRAVRVEATLGPDRFRLLTAVHICVLFFCKTVQQEQVVTAIASGSGGIMQAELLPKAGAFGGEGRWVIRPCGAGGSRACLDVQLVLVPQFWVPPLIGPWLIRSKMSEEAQRTSQGLERVARGSAPR